MKSHKYELLEQAMDEFLDEIADGEDGYMSSTLHEEMARAAAAAYDASMNIQDFMKREGYEL